MSDLFEHFIGLSSLMANIEEHGGCELGAYLSRNEKFISKCEKFSDRHAESEESSSQYATVTVSFGIVFFTLFLSP